MLPHPHHDHRIAWQCVSHAVRRLSLKASKEEEMSYTNYLAAVADDSRGWPSPTAPVLKDSDFNPVLFEEMTR